LYRERNIIVQVYGRNLVNRSVIQILKMHRRVRMIAGELSVVDTEPLILALAAMNDIGSCQVDVGKLAIDYKNSGKGQTPTEFLRAALAPAIGLHTAEHPTDVVLYGFGRIGRLLARLLIERTGVANSLRLRAIVVRGGRDGDLEKRASLLRRDSVHGPFNGSIEVDEVNAAPSSPTAPSSR
jgi:glyceraldehyde 3-phosphate dehydrogenase